MINWEAFEIELINIFINNNNKFGTSKNIGKKIASLYHNYIMQGQDKFGNKPLITNKMELEKELIEGFEKISTMTNIQKTKNILESIFNTAINKYWTGAQLTINGASSGVINKVSSPIAKITINWPSSTRNITILSKLLRRAFESQVKKIKGVFVIITSSGSPASIAWTGLR